MKTRLIAIFGTLTALAAALTPIAEAAGRWGVKPTVFERDATNRRR